HETRARFCFFPVSTETNLSFHQPSPAAFGLPRSPSRFPRRQGPRQNSSRDRKPVMLPSSVDVVVVGAGNAAFCAALAAREANVSVLVLERAPEEEAGGNSRFTAGAFRCVYDGVEDLKILMPDLTPDEIANTDFGTYTQEQFFDDMGRITEY